MTLKEAWIYGDRYLKEQDVAESALDAWYLLEHVTGVKKSYYYAHGEEQLTDLQEQSYKELVKRRGTHVPLQHLTGYQEFMGLRFLVSSSVLIPRQDTETLVEEALKVLRPGMRVLDVCTGSGCILLSLLHHCPGTEGIGLDISSDALAVAKKNAIAMGFAEEKKTSGKACFLKSNMFEHVTPEETFDCILSNPPYIASGELDALMEEVRDHDPRLALDGGEDGLCFYRILAKEAGKYLKEQGHLFLEIGYDQGAAVSGLLWEAGYDNVRVIRDLCGNDRVVCAIKGR